MATVAVATEDAMLRFGRALASSLRAGDLVLLSGPLGAGKTTLARGIGDGLGVRGPIASPTFIIARTHPSEVGGPDLVHVDAYRLGSLAEIDHLDLDTSLDDAVTLVEWGEGKAEALASDRLLVVIERERGVAAEPANPGTLDDSGGGGTRTVTVTAQGERWAGLDLTALKLRSHAVILAIDTSAAVAVAVVDDTASDGGADRSLTVAARSEFAPRGHAELLAVFVKEALAESGVSCPDRVVVGTGPAPFTGLRVGIVTARMLAFAWSVPCDGVCSLDAVAAAIAGEVTVVADARRKEVYWATYRDGVRLTEPRVDAPGSVAAIGTVVGRGAAMYPELFPGAQSVDPDPARLVAVATAARRAGATDLPTEPLYLRRPDVHGVPA